MTNGVNLGEFLWFSSCSLPLCRFRGVLMVHQKQRGLQRKILQKWLVTPDVFATSLYDLFLFIQFLPLIFEFPNIVGSFDFK
jgi:hypothetical protein